MQEKSHPTAKIFTERTDQLAKALEVPVRALGPWLGISGTTLFLGRRKDAALSKKTWRKLEQAEARARRPDLPWGLVPETPEDASKERDPPPPEPTQAEILAFVAATHSRAGREPGGLGWCYQELRGIFPPGKFDSPEKPR
jgi:hypothetical protein